MKKLIPPMILMALMLVLLFSSDASATKHTINVQNFSFSPANINNVQIGDTIRWVWVSGSHTTTSSTIPGGAASWDSPITSTVQSFEYKVLVSGTYNYVCTPHESMDMVGSFTVSAAPALSVSPLNQDVSATSGNTTFSVLSNSSWVASSNQLWCTVTPSGSGNGTINANYTGNTSVNPRQANITVTVSGIPSTTVTVTQAGAVPTLSVNPPNQDVSAEAGTVNFSVTSNTSWSAQSNAEWCMVTSEGSGNSTIAAVYAENTTFETRVAELVISVLNLPPQTVTVSQEASTVSVDKIPLSGFQLFPNPASAYFNILTNSLSSNPADLSILKMDGSVVLQKSLLPGSEKQIDLTGLPSGTYIVNLISGGKTYNQRLAIVH